MREPLATPAAVPRAYLDPITSGAAALSVVTAAISLPMQPETLAIWLDHEWLGGLITVVSGAGDPDAAVEVCEFLAQAGSHHPLMRGLILASVRPHSGLAAGDIDRWLDASDIMERHGLELIEWFIVGSSGVECPRDLLGEPTRWPLKPLRHSRPAAAPG